MLALRFDGAAAGDQDYRKYALAKFDELTERTLGCPVPAKSVPATRVVVAPSPAFPMLEGLTKEVTGRPLPTQLRQVLVNGGRVAARVALAAAE